MKDVIRLNGQSHSILHKYSSTPNKAITEMERTISTLKREIETLKVATDIAYWKKLSETVDGCLEKLKGY